MNLENCFLLFLYQAITLVGMMIKIIIIYLSFVILSRYIFNDSIPPSRCHVSCILLIFTQDLASCCTFPKLLQFSLFSWLSTLKWRHGKWISTQKCRVGGAGIRGRKLMFKIQAQKPLFPNEDFSLVFWRIPVAPRSYCIAHS